jgi:hypothetical protein
MKRPSFQFYPNDWRTDQGLRLCSLPARALWIEMMCLMHEGEPYGYLNAGGKPITPVQLARLVGESSTKVHKYLKELQENFVFSSTGREIFSRRMVKDEMLRNMRAENGKNGAEHGIKGKEYGVLGGRPRGINNPPNKPPKERGEKPPPSSSSSSSFIPLSKDNGSIELFEQPTQPPDMDKIFWDSAKAYLGKSKASLVGKWIAKYGKSETFAAIAAAQSERAVEPIAFVEGVLRKTGHDNDPHDYGWGQTMPC